MKVFDIMRGFALLLMFAAVGMVVISCGDTEPGGPEEPTDTYDREALLRDIADNFIVPGYTTYLSDLTALKTATESFVVDPDTEALQAVRSAYLDAALRWQRVSMFEIGPAEAISLRNRTNIYPTSTSEIDTHIASGVYNLALPSTVDAQGFPAIDYLLYGIATDDASIITQYEDDSEVGAYLIALVSTLEALTSEVLGEWTSQYRSVFINDSGTSATSSVNKLVNDFIFYYERFLRAGKIGIPAGVFSGNPLPETVEGRYSRTHAKVLFLESLDAVTNFFRGEGETSGESLLSYLEHLGEDQAAIGSRIMDQLAVARAKAENLNDDFGYQVESDNQLMLETYDELQKVVVLIKVDMLQALNIKIDFVDADGD